MSTLLVEAYREVANVDLGRRVKKIPAFGNAHLQCSFASFDVAHFVRLIVFHPRKALLGSAIGSTQNMISIFRQIVVRVVSIWISPMNARCDDMLDCGLQDNGYPV